MNNLKKISIVLGLAVAIFSQGCVSTEKKAMEDSKMRSELVKQMASSKTTTNNVAPATGVASMKKEVAPAPVPNDIVDERTVTDGEKDKQDFNTEEYNRIYENPFLEVTKNPLSTFSIDVDTASYSNVRRYLTNKTIPPKDSVRIEEMVNYFTYNYPQPKDDKPFSINLEYSDCPWKSDHKLLQIGLQGKKIETEKMPANNLVFLLDVSGSMSDYNKLPLLKSAFKLLVGQLKDTDTVSIVVYAGAAGTVLPPTTGKNKEKILAALDSLEAGGSTAGGEGIQLAYKVAKENLLQQGNNRVILATDGDFNVGASSDGELVRMIEEKRKQGIFLTILGFGMGNYKDSKVEQLADKGNGNYYYIDDIKEAKKVLITEMGGTLLTIAKDVKLQIEFNPAKISSYRLIGYENRLLRNEDFNDDTKDAGELGSGHTVTALYEIVPAGGQATPAKVDDLKYQNTEIKPESFDSKEVLTVKFRYKDPNADTSKLISETLQDSQVVSLEKTSDNFRFASSVAGFGLLLRQSEYKGNITYDKVIEMAEKSKGQDSEGYRKEFINLVNNAKSLVK